MKKTQPLFALVCLDVKTGVKHKVRITNPIRRTVDEEKAMFERNVKAELATFEIIQTNETSTKPYEENPFDSALKEEQQSSYIIDIGDKEYLPLKVICDAKKEEERWVDSMIDNISVGMYKQCVDAGTFEYKIVDSLCHRGLVYCIFKEEHCHGMNWIRRCTIKIGDKFDPDVLSKLKSSDNKEGIYVNGWYTGLLRCFCEYCEIMFGISKYEVAKCFPKTDPDIIDIKCDSLSKKAYNISVVAAIHAENGNYEQALKYYEMSVNMLEGQSWQPNYQRKLDDFKKYVQDNRTSILSSDF